MPWVLHTPLSCILDEIHLQYNTLPYFIPGRRVDVPNELVEEFADLRSAFAKLLLSYEKELSKSLEAKDDFVAYVRNLFPREMSLCHDFKSTFDKLARNSVSLFNTRYLKCICSILPQDIW